MKKLYLYFSLAIFANIWASYIDCKPGNCGKVYNENNVFCANMMYNTNLGIGNFTNSTGQFWILGSLMFNSAGDVVGYLKYDANVNRININFLEQKAHYEKLDVIIDVLKSVGLQLNNGDLNNCIDRHNEFVAKIKRVLDVNTPQQRQINIATAEVNSPFGRESLDYFSSFKLDKLLGQIHYVDSTACGFCKFFQGIGKLLQRGNYYANLYDNFIRGLDEFFDKKLGSALTELNVKRARGTL